MTRPATLGFDRKVMLAWLDMTVVATQKVGVSSKLKGHMVRQLDGQGLGAVAQDKTATVLTHIWGTVPQSVRGLRDEGLRLWAEVEPAERVALHWGMALATYPFFRDVVDVCGRLFRLQPVVTVGQVERRIIERWGDRSTVRRAVQRVLRSLHGWGLLVQQGPRGGYAGVPEVLLHREVGEWLLAACLAARPDTRILVASLLEHPTLFPFATRVTPQDLRQSPRFESEREGLDAEMIVLRETTEDRTHTSKVSTKKRSPRTHARPAQYAPNLG
jgi:hypothetical protein